jgi:hypothetical protein
MSNIMATAEISLHLEYADTFEVENLLVAVKKVLGHAKDKGALNLSGAENSDSQGVEIKCTGIGRIWAASGITILLDYADAFDFEDLRTIIHNVFEEAMSNGDLTLLRSENSESEGEEIVCTAIGRIFPDWRE